MTINFQDPRLQRRRQKMAALGPESRAILNTMADTAEFAGNEALKELRLMSIGNALRAQRQDLDISKRSFANLKEQRRMQLEGDRFNLNLANRQTRYDKKMGSRAAMLNILGMVPRGYMGYKAYQQSGQTANDLLQLAKEIGG